MAASTSSTSEAANSPITSRVSAGLSEGKVLPHLASTDSPLIKFRYFSFMALFRLTIDPRESRRRKLQMKPQMNTDKHRSAFICVYLCSSVVSFMFWLRPCCTLLIHCGFWIPSFVIHFTDGGHYSTM